MAVEAVTGATPAWFVEFDKAPSKILAHHWPDVPNYGDVTKINWETMPPVDILTGGYPCQPFSQAGQRKGTNDDRHLWPYVREAIRVLRPRFTILENVAGHRSLGFDRVLGDMAEDGLHVRWTSIRASDVGAPPTTASGFSSSRPPTVVSTPDTMPDAPNSGSNMRTRPAGLGNQVKMLPTPKANDFQDNNSPAEAARRSPALTAVSVHFPTPTASDATGGGQRPSKRAGHTRQLIDTVLGLTGNPTPPLFDGGSD